MIDKINALLIGDFTEAPWHPLEPARQELESILGSEFRLAATEDYNDLSKLDRQQYALCIAYTDCWNRQPVSEQTAGLLQYVAGGGGLLVLHNGISLQISYELQQMLGARFTGHPPYQLLQYYRSMPNHPLMNGVGDFVLEEEPYMFDFDPFTPKKVVLEFEYEGNRHPAAWELTFGLGRVVYLQPGHHAPSFRPESYRRLVLNSARWVTSDDWIANHK
jgi:uncharacterized protein